jgi:hypothetical protein
LNLALILNHRCNLRCKYCYTGRKFDRAMPLDVAKKAVDFGLACSTTGHLTLSFFGGEPLLEVEAMEAIVPYAKRRAQDASRTLAFSISTNGTLLDERRLNLLRDHISLLVRTELHRRGRSHCQYPVRRTEPDLPARVLRPGACRKAAARDPGHAFATHQTAVTRPLYVTTSIRMRQILVALRSGIDRDVP